MSELFNTIKKAARFGLKVSFLQTIDNPVITVRVVNTRVVNPWEQKDFDFRWTLYEDEVVNFINGKIQELEVQ